MLLVFFIIFKKFFRIFVKKIYLKYKYNTLLFYILYVNDPSAGSPTETLLRLLLPLNDQVWSSSRQHRQCRNIAAHQSEDLTKSFNR